MCGGAQSRSLFAPILYSVAPHSTVTERIAKLMPEPVPPASEHVGVHADSEPRAAVVRVPLAIAACRCRSLAAIAVVFALEWAQAFLISLLLGVL